MYLSLLLGDQTLKQSIIFLSFYLSYQAFHHFSLISWYIQDLETLDSEVASFIAKTVISDSRAASYTGKIEKNNDGRVVYFKLKSKNLIVEKSFLKSEKK